MFSALGMELKTIAFKIYGCVKLCKKNKNSDDFSIAEFVWSQEEPENMGGWQFVEPRFRKQLGVQVSNHTLLSLHTHIRPSLSSSPYS